MDLRVRVAEATYDNVTGKRNGAYFEVDYSGASISVRVTLDGTDAPPYDASICWSDKKSASISESYNRHGTLGDGVYGAFGFGGNVAAIRSWLEAGAIQMHLMLSWPEHA